MCVILFVSCRYNREEVVRSLGKEINLNPPLTLGQLPDTPEELLKLDQVSTIISIRFGNAFFNEFFWLQVFIKSELKVGIIYVKENQFSEEQILDNNDNSPLFDEFLQVLGDKVRLRGFDKYKGGLDTVHDLTGEFLARNIWLIHKILLFFSLFSFYLFTLEQIGKCSSEKNLCQTSNIYRMNILFIYHFFCFVYIRSLLPFLLSVKISISIFFSFFIFVFFLSSFCLLLSSN